MSQNGAGKRKTGREGCSDRQKEDAAQEDEMRIEDNYGQGEQKRQGKNRRGIINKPAGPQQAIFGLWEIVRRGREG
jgi:hypothetical protein